ncbi:MAG: hypothetical protein RL346_1942 [Verrucomicrobiota bacterium]
MMMVRLSGHLEAEQKLELEDEQTWQINATTPADFSEIVRKTAYKSLVLERLCTPFVDAALQPGHQFLGIPGLGSHGHQRDPVQLGAGLHAGEPIHIQFGHDRLGLLGVGIEDLRGTGQFVQHFRR